MKLFIDKTIKVKHTPSSPYVVKSKSPKESKSKHWMTEKGATFNDFSKSEGKNTSNQVKITPSKIIEINPQNIVLECLIDKKNQIFEIREFPIILFKKYKELKEGSTFNLKLIQSPNFLYLEVSKLNNTKIKSLFDTSSLFQDLEDFENIHFQ